jgi:hypothetical protein
MPRQTHLGQEEHLTHHACIHRQRSMKEIVINPENFAADKILNMLDEKKLENLQNEFEKIVKEDIII